MKTELIKELYKKFRSEYDDDWYSRYKKTVAMVEVRRQTLPQNSLSAEGDKELLDWLIAEKSQTGNGISSARLCMLGDNSYRELIADQTFMAAISAYMLNPTQEGFAAFVSCGTNVLKGISDRAIANGGKRQNNINERYNRFASACNLNLTVVVDSARFNWLFATLVAKKIIDPLPVGRGEDWHSKNLWLTEQLRSSLQFAPGDSVQVDDCWRNIFV